MEFITGADSALDEPAKVVSEIINLIKYAIVHENSRAKVFMHRYGPMSLLLSLFHLSLLLLSVLPSILPMPLLW
jgi:hypothetical protein